MTVSLLVVVVLLVIPFCMLIVTVLPVPEVLIPFDPLTFRLFAAGVAVPESSVYVVATVGGTGPEEELLAPD